MNPVTNVLPIACEPPPVPTDAENLALAQIFIIRMRRNIRRLAEWNKWERDHIRYLKKEAQRLTDRGNPFDTARIAHIKARIHDRESYCHERSELMKENARLMINAAPAIDKATTLEERCSLLNVNVSDRGDLNEADGIVQLIYLHRLEDSATYRGKEDWDFDAPMHKAMMLVYMDFLINTPEGKKIGDSLFEPGGMFEFLPMYKQAADGTTVRQPPPLRLA